jgi:hypothetical protein
MSTPRPAEQAIVIAAPYLLIGVAAALPLFLVPNDWSLLARTTIHLTALVSMALALALQLAGLVESVWFPDRGWPEARKRLAAAATLIALVALVVGLVTLATSAALRFQPSLQFLQLLSSLDIAWAVTALVIGTRLLRGSGAAFVAGVALDVVCVGALWNYLRLVGFETDGGWLLDGDRLGQLVIPADMAAAAVAIVVLGFGLRSLAQPIGQASDQS